MQRKKVIIGFIAVLAVGAGWFLFRPERLIINETVHEELPAAAQPGSVRVESEGHFHGVAHSGTGKATVHRLADGSRVLRFTEFETSNGPDLRVYLIAADDANDSDTVKRSEVIELSPLKGNRGDQNYELPAGIDLSKYRSVTVWCKRFGVNFATAPLARPAHI
jgi:hypothetical protein